MILRNKLSYRKIDEIKKAWNYIINNLTYKELFSFINENRESLKGEYKNIIKNLDDIKKFRFLNFEDIKLFNKWVEKNAKKEKNKK